MKRAQGELSLPNALESTSRPLTDSDRPSPIASHPSLFSAIHRHLRGRYALTLVLATAGAGAGGYVGWGSQQPLYRAEGLVYISPSVRSPRDPAGQNVLPWFRGFVALQVQLLESLRATHYAMEADLWKEANGGGEGLSSEAIRRFVERRAILHEPDTQHVAVTFTDESPDVALAGVQALLDAYRKIVKFEGADDQDLVSATEKVKSLSADIKDRTDQVLKLTADLGGEEGLEARLRAALARLLALEDELGKLGDIRARGGAGPASAAASFIPRSAREIALDSPQLATELLQVGLLEGEAEVVGQRFPEGNDRLVALRQQIAVRKQWIATFTDDWNRRAMEAWQKSPASERTREEALAEFQARESALAKQIESARGASQSLARVRSDVQVLRADRDDLTLKLDAARELKEQLESELAVRGRVSVIDEGRRPSLPFKDRRRTMAALLGTLGGLLGPLLVLVSALMSRKLRGAEDVGHALSHLRLLGLVPALDVGHHDASGDEIASHCVHQVRTLLQLGHLRQGWSTICVTGAGVGSGKTTMSLALGLSFSGSGTRTLLVDADLAGRGLTWRIGQMLFSGIHAADGLAINGGPGDSGHPSPTGAGRTVMGLQIVPLYRDGMSAPLTLQQLVHSLEEHLQGPAHGVAPPVEVLSRLFAAADLLFPGTGRQALDRRLSTEPAPGRSGGSEHSVPAPRREVDESGGGLLEGDVAEFLFPTGMQSLSFLPLRGLGRGGSVSVATLVSILDRIEPRFDVVIVDTGPVLGTVETPIVAAHADAAVFVVSPSDRSSDADMAVCKLEEVGAKVAGVVFNRAGPRDVLRASHSHSSINGVPRVS